MERIPVLTVHVNLRRLCRGIVVVFVVGGHAPAETDIAVATGNPITLLSQAFEIIMVLAT